MEGIPYRAGNPVKLLKIFFGRGKVQDIIRRIGLGHENLYTEISPDLPQFYDAPRRKHKDGSGCQVEIQQIHAVVGSSFQNAYDTAFHEAGRLT
jgi:hypothetical protein